MNTHELYMHRCLQLARLGAGSVAPNPMVGSVLVYEGRIIGEGYHRQWGGPHAEVECIQSVKEENRMHIPHAVIYVSLEPCAHHGKTPPCADLIIRMGIHKAVIGCRDPFPEVNGKGLEKLRAAGVEVIAGVLEQECLAVNKRFFTFHTQQRPYVILKWAQTANGKMAGNGTERLFISNEYTNRIVHKWRSEEAAILVGANTALKDDPSLTTRLWPGNNPVRLVIDRKLQLPAHLKLFNGEASTIVLNRLKHGFSDDKISPATIRAGGISYFKIDDSQPLAAALLQALYQLQLLSVLIEGGAAVLGSFIAEGCWDEARVITADNLTAGPGLSAPVLHQFSSVSTEQVFTDTIRTYCRS